MDCSRKRTSRAVAEDELLRYAEKKALRLVKKLKTNPSNPFGDSNLNDKFVWLKKIERDLSLGQGFGFSIKEEKERQRVRMMEIEKVNKRKQLKAMEKAQRQEQIALLARARAQAEFQDWERKEQDFDFHQSKVRSQIRLRQGRARPIDVLTHHLNGEIEAKAFLEQFHAKMRPRKHLQLTEEAEDEAGSFSPQLLHVDHNEEDVEAIDPEQDRAILDRKRLLVLQERQRPIAAPSDDQFEMKAIKVMGPMEDGDALFGSAAQVHLDSQVYDRDRPRKPKYFNRVHTGYEWNKYNQTHYDHDNPPPKFVHGYKFNIFYPDLVDNVRAPTYSIEKDDASSNGDTCILRFHAGPPYEDLAFRIVNHEWEYSQKKGFKNTFKHGILHLYFNLKRYRYRR